MGKNVKNDWNRVHVGILGLHLTWSKYSNVMGVIIPHWYILTDDERENPVKLSRAGKTLLQLVSGQQKTTDS